jgi:hypothetical protein
MTTPAMFPARAYVIGAWRDRVHHAVSLHAGTYVDPQDGNDLVSLAIRGQHSDEHAITFMSVDLTPDVAVGLAEWLLHSAHNAMTAEET